jgi:hypothetical protein
VVRLTDEAGNLLDDQRWAGLFDLSLAGCGERWMDSCDLVAVPRRGHFNDPDLPWERLSFDPAESGV